jgi:hypothetical protein
MVINDYNNIYNILYNLRGNCATKISDRRFLAFASHFPGTCPKEAAMSAKKVFSVPFVLIAVCVVLAITLASFPSQVQARNPLQASDGSQCITCHEDLYYLHDTGKAYCLKDSPMTCVDCHGGNPTALTKEEAHFNRSAHPVINEDGKKCYECHPAEADTRLEEFRQVAGISEIKLAATCEPANVPGTAGFLESQSEQWTPTPQAMALFVVVGMMLVIFIGFKVRR